MRGRVIFAVTMMIAIMALSSFAAVAASQTDGVATETTPWYEAAWNAVSDAATFCGDIVVDSACAVGDGAKYLAGSYLLWYADINGTVTAWAQETGTELVG